MIPSFDRGDLIRLGNVVGDNDDGTTREPFTNLASVATDPTAVSLQVLKPGGTLLVYNWPLQGPGDGVLDHPSTGRFSWDLHLDETGAWAWQLSGTGTVETSEAGRFFVRWSPFA